MREELLKQLIEKTFIKLACPLQGNGVYAELQNAIIAAYNLGMKKDEMIPENILSMPSGS